MWDTGALHVSKCNQEPLKLQICSLMKGLSASSLKKKIKKKKNGFFLVDMHKDLKLFIVTGSEDGKSESDISALPALNL